MRNSAGVGAVVSPGQSKKERTCDSLFHKAYIGGNWTMPLIMAKLKTVMP